MTWSVLLGNAFAHLLLAHVVGDFFLQSDALLERKKRFTGLLEHGAIHACLYVVALAPLAARDSAHLKWYALAVITLAIGHIILDAIKTRSTSEWYSKGILGFILDQCLHVLLLIGIASILRPEVGAAWLEPTRKAAVLAAAGLFATRGGMFFVRIMVEDLRPQERTAETNRAGRRIGIIERLLIFTLVILGQWGAVGFVLTAKSLARFRQLEEKEFAEYYLIGTLTSSLVALAMGLLVRLLWPGKVAPA